MYMEKDKIFFAESGLTSTSANYVANKAKEMYRGMETRLNKMTFYTTTVKLLGTADDSLLQKGVDSVSDVKDDLMQIGKLKSLISWLREAIKAKESLLEEVKNSSYEDYGLEVPQMPTRVAGISEDDYIATLDIKRRNRYYYLEALCATIGQYIHPDGAYSNARQKLMDVLNEPHQVTGQGRDTLMYTRIPSLPPEKVEQTFMELQTLHREHQAELNSMKHEIEEAVRKDAMDKIAEYNHAMQLWKNEMATVESQLEEKKKAAAEAVGKLKITIPSALCGAYDLVESYGKD